MHAQDIEDEAGRLYTVYCHAVGGKAYDGRPLPSWDEFSTDPGKQTQANGWRALGGLQNARIRELEQQVEVLTAQNPTKAAAIALEQMERVKRLETVVLAACRLQSHKYPAWEDAGGRPECEHGICTSIPCYQCDLNTVRDAAEKLKGGGE